MGDDVRSILERARRGDRDAFGQLVLSYQRRVYMTAYRMMGNHDDANDVAQDAFIRAYRGIARFDARSDFFTWLYRILVNVALNHLRQRRRRRTVSIDEVALPAPLAEEAGDDPRRALELKRMVFEIGQALETLPVTLRATLVLVILEGLPYREAAEILDCSEGTVAWRVHEARKLLHDPLGKFLTGSDENENDNDGLPGDTTKAVDVRG
jgi:RNA polymerase sigma-70 factor (ECF subfamily)